MHSKKAMSKKPKHKKEPLHEGHMMNPEKLMPKKIMKQAAKRGK